MKKSYQNIIIIFLVCLVLLAPFLIKDYAQGHDTLFHVANISATLETMDDFIPDDILPEIAGNYGYATRQFYPILGHTTAAYIAKFTGVSVTAALKITYTLILFLSGVTMYFLSQKLSDNKKIALMSAIIYMSFPYHLFDIYVRDALSETYLFVFIPLIFNGLFELFKNKKKFVIFFTVGYVGGMLSHFTMMIYLTLLLIPFFIINIKKVFKKDTIIPLIISAAFILTITMPAVCNMLQNKLDGNYMVFYPEHMAQGIWHSGVQPIDLINYFSSFPIIFNNDLSLYLNIAVVFLLVVTIIKFRKKELPKLTFEYKYMLIFGIASSFMVSILFPWDILPGFLRMVQFPWRFVTFVAIFVSLFAPLCITKFKIKQLYIISNVAIIALALVFDAGVGKTNINTENIQYSYGRGWQNEYFTYNTYNNFDYFNNREYGIVSDSAKTSILSDEMKKLVFTVDTDTKATIELPRLYYHGYVIYDSNGERVSIYQDEYGFIATDVNSGEYTLEYERTMLIKVSYAVSGVSMITFIAYTILIKNKKSSDASVPTVVGIV